jgi:hypothetical protein
MPEGIVRRDLNTTGVTSKNGNPIPPTAASDNTNPVAWTKSPAHFGNPVPATDPTFNSNPVTWTKSPTHFGNLVGGSGSVSGFLLEDSSGVILLEDGSILLLEA